MKYLILILVLLFPVSTFAKNYTCTFNSQVMLGMVNGKVEKDQSEERTIIKIDVDNLKISGNIGTTNINIIKNDEYQLYFSESLGPFGTSSIFRLNKLDGVIVQTKNVGPIEPKYGLVNLGKCK